MTTLGEAIKTGVTRSGALVPANRRILVIDDNRSIHADFRKLLGAPDGDDAALAAAEAKFLGTEPAVAFEVDAASQGEEGLQMVEQARAEGRPYALAFVDMRMPPGWDGIETTKRIWHICPELQIVICTAFADVAWEDVLPELAPHDRLLVLKKPFDAIEVTQLAGALTEKWRLEREAQFKLADLEAAVKLRTRDLEESQLAALNIMEDAVQSREQIEQALTDLKQEMGVRERAEEKARVQLAELVRWQKVMTGREDRVRELKAEVNELLRRHGEAVRYSSVDNVLGSAPATTSTQ